MKSETLEKRHSQERSHGQMIATFPERAWGQETRAGQVRILRRACLIREATGMQPGHHVLELGCGTGNYTEFFAKSGATLQAIDISEDLLSIARKKLPHVDFHCDIAEELRTIPDASQDAVVGNAILHHLDIPLTLRASLRVLRPGGIFCFTEPNMLNPQIAAERNIPFFRRLLWNTPDETAFFRWKITTQLREAGYINASARPFDFLHPWTPSFLFPFVQGISFFLEKTPLLREIAGSLLIIARKP